MERQHNSKFILSQESNSVSLFLHHV